MHRGAAVQVASGGQRCTCLDKEGGANACTYIASEPWLPAVESLQCSPQHRPANLAEAWNCRISGIYGVWYAC